MRLLEIEQRTETFMQGITDGRLSGKVINGFRFGEFSVGRITNSPLRIRYNVSTDIAAIPELEINLHIDVLHHYKNTKHEVQVYRGHSLEVRWGSEGPTTRFSSDCQLSHDIDPTLNPITDLNNFLKRFKDVIKYEIHQYTL